MSLPMRQILADFTEGVKYIIPLYKAPWLRTFAATHRHRLRAQNCWTLAIVLRVSREWGFWNNEQWIQWERYVDSVQATLRKDC